MSYTDKQSEVNKLLGEKEHLKQEEVALRKVIEAVKKQVSALQVEQLEIKNRVPLECRRASSSGRGWAGLQRRWSKWVRRNSTWRCSVRCTAAPLPLRSKKKTLIKHLEKKWLDGKGRDVGTFGEKVG